jgi:hypothetical protein
MALVLLLMLYYFLNQQLQFTIEKNRWHLKKNMGNMFLNIRPQKKYNVFIQHVKKVLRFLIWKG